MPELAESCERKVWHEGGGRRIVQWRCQGLRNSVQSASCPEADGTALLEEQPLRLVFARGLQEDPAPVTGVPG